MGNSTTVPDVCERCGKPVQIIPHRSGDYPNRPVHTMTHKVEC